MWGAVPPTSTFARMMTITHDPCAAAHHVANRLAAWPENRGIQNVVDVLMRERCIAGVEHDDIGAKTRSDGARLLPECLPAAACGTAPQRCANG